MKRLSALIRTSTRDSAIKSSALTLCAISTALFLVFDARAQSQSTPGSSGTAPVYDAMTWSSESFVFRGIFGPRAVRGLPPTAGSVDVIYEVFDSADSTLLARAAGKASIRTTSNRAAVITMPVPYAMPAGVRADLQSLTLNVELAEGRTIRAVESCWISLQTGARSCKPATGSFSGPTFDQFVQATRAPTVPGARADAAVNAGIRSMSNSIQSHRDTILDITRNMNSSNCRPGDYGCPR